MKTELKIHKWTPKDKWLSYAERKQALVVFQNEDILILYLQVLTQKDYDRDKLPFPPINTCIRHRR